MSENYIEEYWKWLDSIDERLKNILVALDDDLCTGRVGSRSNFNGDFECRLYAATEDQADFVKLYMQSAEERIKNGSVKDYVIESEAKKWWNVITYTRTEMGKKLIAEMAKG